METAYRKREIWEGDLNFLLYSLAVICYNKKKHIF